jgi:hypothetical protein
MSDPDSVSVATTLFVAAESDSQFSKQHKFCDNQRLCKARRPCFCRLYMRVHSSIACYVPACRVRLRPMTFWFMVRCQLISGILSWAPITGPLSPASIPEINPPSATTHGNSHPHLLRGSREGRRRMYAMSVRDILMHGCR